MSTPSLTMFTATSQHVNELPTRLSARQLLMRQIGIPVIEITAFTMLPLAIISLIQRLRRAGEVERQQIKWFAFAGTQFGVVLIVDLCISLTTTYHWIDIILWNAVLPFLAAALPVAVAFAILRHRLFDIDLIIRRTLIYATLTAILAAIYLITVIILQAILRSLVGGNSPVIIVIS